VAGKSAELASDADHGAGALAELNELWDVLYPQEKTRIVHLLVERVVYQGDRDGIQVVFRPETFGKRTTGPYGDST